MSIDIQKLDGLASELLVVADDFYETALTIQDEESWRKARHIADKIVSTLHRIASGTYTGITKSLGDSEKVDALFAVADKNAHTALRMIHAMHYTGQCKPDPLHGCQIEGCENFRPESKQIVCPHCDSNSWRKP